MNRSYVSNSKFILGITTYNLDLPSIYPYLVDDPVQKQTRSDPILEGAQSTNRLVHERVGKPGLVVLVVPVQPRRRNTDIKNKFKTV